MVLKIRRTYFAICMAWHEMWTLCFCNKSSILSHTNNLQQERKLKFDQPIKFLYFHQENDLQVFMGESLSPL